MTKKPDTLKVILGYWPLIVAVVGGIGTCAVLLYRQNQDEARLTHHGDWIQRVEAKTNDNCTECKVLEAKIGR